MIALPEHAGHCDRCDDSQPGCEVGQSVVGDVGKTRRGRMTKAGVDESFHNSDVPDEYQHGRCKPGEAGTNDGGLTPARWCPPQQDGDKRERAEGGRGAAQMPSRVS